MKIRADSINPDGNRITSIEFDLPRCLLAQFNTHGLIRSNTASSRAIPVSKYAKNVFENPYVPTLTKNQRGMVGTALSAETAYEANELIYTHLEDALLLVDELSTLGVHKQNANRYLEPFSYVTILATATDWDNFFMLRCASDVQDDFYSVAIKLKALYDASIPEPLEFGQYHYPKYTSLVSDDLEVVLKRSVAHNARLSYLTHDNINDESADLELHDRLLNDGHMTPFEHVAKALPAEELNIVGLGERVVDDNGVYKFTRCFQGWYSYRHMIEDAS